MTFNKKEVEALIHRCHETADAQPGWRNFCQENASTLTAMLAEIERHSEANRQWNEAFDSLQRTNEKLIAERDMWKETSVRDAKRIDELAAERDGWIASAKHFSDGMQYYRDQLDTCARKIGLPCFTADDSGVHPEPLRAKVAECVGQLVAERDAYKKDADYFGGKLAASQARGKQMRKALVCIELGTEDDKPPYRAISKEHMARIAHQALTLPSDDTALREYVAKELETLAAKYDTENERELFSGTVADEIWERVEQIRSGK